MKYLFHGLLMCLTLTMFVSCDKEEVSNNQDSMKIQFVDDMQKAGIFIPIEDLDRITVISNNPSIKKGSRPICSTSTASLSVDTENGNLIVQQFPHAPLASHTFTYAYDDFESEAAYENFINDICGWSGKSGINHICGSMLRTGFSLWTDENGILHHQFLEYGQIVELTYEPGEAGYGDTIATWCPL